MKKLLILAFLATISTASFAQKKEDKTKVKTETTASSTTVKHKLKKDGTIDKRYKANKGLKKDGTPDKRFKKKA